MGVQNGVYSLFQWQIIPHHSHRRGSIGPTSAGSARAAASDRRPPNTRRGAAAAATIGGGDSGGKRWATMDCGSVVAPTLTLDHALPPASDDDDDAGQPMVGRRRRATKWGCVCEMTGGDAGAQWGRARPWTVASGGGSHCRCRELARWQREEERGPSWMRWRCWTVDEHRLRRRTCTDDDEHAQERSGETAAAVAVDEMSERERGRV